MNKYEALFGLGALAIVAAATTYFLTDKKRQEVKKTEAEATLPPEYWQARVAEAKASIEKHRIDSESKERLTLDLRDREALEQANRREFEKSAPPEYWEHKKIAEEEATKRRIEKLHVDADRDRERDRLDAEKAIAKSKSDAIKDSAKMVSKAISRTNESFYM